MEKLDQEQSSFTSITQIDPEQPLNVSVHQDKHLSERSLLGCVQHILSWHDMAFSEAAIRDLPETVNIEFDIPAAVSVFDALDFSTSFGKLKIKKIKKLHCPCIIFSKSDEAIIVEEISDSGLLVTVNPLTDERSTISRKEANDLLNDYVILIQKPLIKKSLRSKNSWFWGSFSNSKWLYSQVALAAVLTNFLGLSTSLFIMVVYDRVVPNEAIESLIALTIGVVIALVFDFIIKMLRASFVDRAGKRADGKMARLIFDKLLIIKLDERNQNTGALASIVKEFDTLREFFTSATLIAIVDLPFVFFFIWVISLIAGPLALVPLIAVPLVIFTGAIVQPFLATLAAGSMESSMSKQSVLVETLNGLETVQATGSGRLMRRRFEEASETQSEIGLKNRALSQFAINSAASVQQFAQIATIFYGVFLIKDGTITMGAMIAAVILGGRTLAPLSQLASAMSRANGARQAFKSISGVMNDLATNEDNHSSRLSRPVLKGSIELKNVTYGFPGSQIPVINDLSLKIPSGQKIAILGRMGSGKSTLARMISGLAQPNSGAVLLDGVDIRQIDKSDLRRNMGIMLQETWLFSGSVRENIQMGFFEYSDEHILNLAKVTCVDDFVASHPQGYDLLLRERGEGLSGGQRQSLNLARSLLHDPNLLILDEPTSSMDTATEKKVLSNLKLWAKDKTVIMVTHRNSLLELADRVLVLDQGKIIADTTPAALKANK
jgi:ATP-binding cassette subfamily C protein LapB